MRGAQRGSMNKQYVVPTGESVAVEAKEVIAGLAIVKRGDWFGAQIRHRGKTTTTWMPNWFMVIQVKNDVRRIARSYFRKALTDLIANGNEVYFEESPVSLGEFSTLKEAKQMSYLARRQWDFECHEWGQLVVQGVFQTLEQLRDRAASPATKRVLQRHREAYERQKGAATQ